GATVGSVIGALFPGRAAFFLAAACPSPFPAEGTIDAILSFSISSKPYSVLTLNMLSSKPTITPLNFRPSFSRISSAPAGRGSAQQSATQNAPEQRARRRWLDFQGAQPANTSISAVCDSVPGSATTVQSVVSPP